MFTKEKLEKWIDSLDECIGLDNYRLRQIKEKNCLYDGVVERKSNLEDLKHTLEQLYTSMTSDNSI